MGSAFLMCRSAAEETLGSYHRGTGKIDAAVQGRSYNGILQDTGTRHHCQHRLSAAQIPRSSKLIYEDNDYGLYSVTLFKRVADSFKQAARSKGFQVLSCFHLTVMIR